MSGLLAGYRNDDQSVAQARRLHEEWEAEVQRNYDTHEAESGLPYQGALIGAVNEHGDPDAVMVGAAGSLPGDMHKLWRARHSKQYHLEYGYSCMGYEIAGGAWHQDGGAGSRGLCHGWRRQLSDDEH